MVSGSPSSSRVTHSGTDSPRALFVVAGVRELSPAADAAKQAIGDVGRTRQTHPGSSGADAACCPTRVCLTVLAARPLDDA